MRGGDVVVVGAGVVGLAVAAALSRGGHAVVVLERHDAIARETTSRNSGVVHAGLYDPPGSAKARLCVRGRELLYARCAERRIPHHKLGKLVVATDAAERATLETLLATGSANGAPGLSLVDGAEVARLEPAVRAVAALRSPETGIVDPEALTLDLAAEAEGHGAQLVLGASLVAASLRGDAWRLEVARSDGVRESVDCGGWVNAAGLGAERVAALAGLDLAVRGERLHLCKGDYFALAPAAPIRVARLVYPVPAGAGLGVHATLDLGGRLRFGPDAEYVASERYAVDPAKAERFAAAARRWLPDLATAWLAPDYAGIRPKLAGPGEGFRDFVIREESAAGCPGLVTLLGIESPGLTAALAIGDEVAGLLAAV